MSTPLSRQMDQMADAQEWQERAEAAEAKLAEAQENAKINFDIKCRLVDERGHLQAKVARLEGLVLDWDDGWRRDPSQDPGAVGRGDEGLMAEARRIRAQREGGKP